MVYPAYRGVCLSFFIIHVELVRVVFPFEIDVRFDLFRDSPELRYFLLRPQSVKNGFFLGGIIFLLDGFFNRVVY